MKTFEEAFRILQVPGTAEGPDPVELENYKQLGHAAVESEEVRQYFLAVNQILLYRNPGCTAEEFSFSLALTVFVAGVRVGQEMEKAE